MPLQIQQLEPFGHRIEGMSIPDLSEMDIDRVTNLLANDGVVVFAKQTLSDDQFRQFLERLGPMMFTTGETQVEGQPMLNVVSNVGRTTPPKSVWHTDTSYVREPPAFTALLAKKLPERGGETLFVNQFEAYDRLAPLWKAWLKETEVRHVSSGVELSDEDESEAWHPLFRRHPESGRTALFLSTPKRCVELSGVDSKLAADLITQLYEHSTDGPVYRHSWSAGDVVLWDDRCTLHRADHSGVTGDRVFYRGLVRGEAPLSAFRIEDRLERHI